MRPPSRPPTLAFQVELEGPIRIVAVCTSAEEEERLALDVLARREAIDEAVRAWAETALEREGHYRRAA